METPKNLFPLGTGPKINFWKKSLTYLKDNGIWHQDTNFQDKMLSRTPHNFSQVKSLKFQKKAFKIERTFLHSFLTEERLLKSKEHFYTHSQQNNGF